MVRNSCTSGMTRAIAASSSVSVSPLSRLLSGLRHRYVEESPAANAMVAAFLGE